MKRRGFTLIELMIVVAILAIVMNYLYPAMQSVIIQDRRQAAILGDIYDLTTLYGILAAELRLCKKVVAADENGVRFDEDRIIRILDGGRLVKVGSRAFKLTSGARFWGCEKMDEHTFSAQIRNGAEDIRVIWRTGAEHE